MATTYGPILAVRLEDLGEKEAVLASHPDEFFTIPHFDGYAAILIQLRVVSAGGLREAVTDGWLACAPPRLADQFLNGSGRGGQPLQEISPSPNHFALWRVPEAKQGPGHHGGETVLPGPHP